LRASVDMLLAEGMDNIVRRHHHLAEGVRQAVSAWGLTNCCQDAQWHSDTVTAIKVGEGFDANDVIKSAYYKFNTSLGGGLSILNGKVFRIGHLGWLNEIMVLQALGGVEMAMRDVGIPFTAGAGVGAAVDYYTSREQAAKVAAE